MTTARENELLTRVGPGTPMGNLMRQYWVPVGRSDEVAADGDPVRIMALGEQLIAFRDSAGRLGIMDHRCPHRCASLFYGRNEENGIRCIYHGWKYDVEGKCVDVPNLPPHQQGFRDKVKAKAYKVAERYGVMWVYLGDRAAAPPFPDFELNELDPATLAVHIIQQEYNWLQGLENDLDTSHFGFLHLGGVEAAAIPAGESLHYLASDRAPQFHLEDTPLGLMYGAYRPADADNTHWRLAQFLAPFWIIPPVLDVAEQILLKAYIPMDDAHTLAITIQPASIARPAAPRPGAPAVPGFAPVMPRPDRYRPRTTDWFGRWRLVNEAANDFLIDREAQRHGGIFSGFRGLAIQDTAIAGTMGPIMDRTFENLAPSDAMIARMRHKLLRLAEAFARDRSIRLPGVNEPGAYRGHRAGNFIAPKGRPFRAAYEEIMRTHAHAAPRWAAE